MNYARILELSPTILVRPHSPKASDDKVAHWLATIVNKEEPRGVMSAFEKVLESEAEAEGGNHDLLFELQSLLSILSWFYYH